LIQIYNAYFDFANFFKDIFKLFSKVLKINKKKQQLTAHWRQFVQPHNANASQTDRQSANRSVVYHTGIRPNEAF
jgi:hypothetical protein